MSCDFPACGYVIYTESIMAMSNKPAAQKTEGTWIPQGAHTATTAGSLHQLPCVQHGRDGQRPALWGGSFYFIRFNICFYIHKSNRRQLCEITCTSSTNCLFTAFLSHLSDIKGSYWENIISEFSRNTASVAFLTLVSGLGFSPSGDPTPGASLLRPSQPRQLVSGRRSLDFCRRKKIQHIKALCSSLL